MLQASIGNHVVELFFYFLETCQVLNQRQVVIRYFSHEKTDGVGFLKDLQQSLFTPAMKPFGCNIPYIDIDSLVTQFLNLGVLASVTMNEYACIHAGCRDHEDGG